MAEIQIVLNDILKDRRLTQSDLAYMTGIRSEAISNIVRGKVERLSLDHLQKIMTALELTDVSKLLKYVKPVEAVIEKQLDDDPLDEQIEILDLPTKTFNTLKRHYGRIKTIRDITDTDLSKVHNIGPRARKTIEEALSAYMDKHK